jgi:carnitine O-acetyltransferase
VVRPVRFVLDAALRTAVEDAGSAFTECAADTATAVLSFPDVGTERIKRLGTSPDAFVQLAYQLAHRRTKGFVGATYESIATRQYRHGRTEAMRVVTPEVLAFVSAMDDSTTSAGTRRSAFRAAAGRHGERARQCQSGQAPEQHLWELQLLQQRQGPDETSRPLALYDSPGWTTMRHDYLSTSSAPSRHIQHFGFGSTSPQCIGIAYVLLPDRFNLYLSTPRAVSAHLEVFGRELGRALTELDELLVESAAPG